ncbi:MAG: response regulator transcription factor [Treponema sp.]|jgi:DNA-binding NarL/FixJ family response regulator|nr:response regulator transcription factor [Treponema sp.]
MNHPVSILIASRHDKDQKYISAILSEHKDFFIAGVEKDESSVIIKSERLKPNILILDFQLPMIDLPDLARIIRRKSPSTAIIILSEKDEPNLAYYALKAGVSGFLLKKEDVDKLALIVRVILSGGCYISVSIITGIFNASFFKNHFQGQFSEHDLTAFTQVERNIVIDLANGLSYSQIAEHLNYSAGSIRNFLTAIKRKTKLKNCIQIVVFALVSGLIHFDHLQN